MILDYEIGYILGHGKTDTICKDALQELTVGGLAIIWTTDWIAKVFKSVW